MNPRAACNPYTQMAGLGFKDLGFRVSAALSLKSGKPSARFGFKGGAFV